MITTVRSVSKSFISHKYHFVVVAVRTIKTYSLSFQAYNTVLTIITMLYIRSPELIHLKTGSLYPLTSISPFPSTPVLWQPPI